MTASLPAKKQVVLALLENTTVFLHLDPRHDGVRVPPWFKKQPQLVLQVGLNMPVPIPDLNVDDECVSCTLSFSRTPFFCWLPWKAIYAVVGEDRRGMVWPDDVPPEVAAQMQPAAPRPALHAVPAKAEAARAEPAPAAELAKSRSKKAAGREAAREAAARRNETKAGDGARDGDSARPGRRRAAKKPKLAPAPKLRDTSTPAMHDAPPKQQPAAAAAKPAAGGKPKRELPPYLRIVK